MGRDLARLLVSALLGCVVSGVGYWLVFGRETVTRREVSDMIRTQGPYVEDRAKVLEILDRNNRAIEKQTTALDQLSGTVIELRTELRMMREQREG